MEEDEPYNSFSAADISTICVKLLRQETLVDVGIGIMIKFLKHFCNEQGLKEVLKMSALEPIVLLSD